MPVRLLQPGGPSPKRSASKLVPNAPTGGGSGRAQRPRSLAPRAAAAAAVPLKLSNSPRHSSTDDDDSRQGTKEVPCGRAESPQLASPGAKVDGGAGAAHKARCLELLDGSRALVVSELEAEEAAYQVSRGLCTTLEKIGVIAGP